MKGNKQFVSIPVTLPNSQLVRYLYCKEHLVKTDEETLKQDRTLFVSNIPACNSSNFLKEVFANFGKVDAIVLGTFRQGDGHSQQPAVETGIQPPNSFAHIVFNKEKSVKKVLGYEGEAIEASDSAEVTGLNAWIESFKQSRVDLEELKASTDKWMADFERKEEEARQEKLRKQNQMDDDGFTLVQRGGKTRNRNIQGQVGVTAARNEQELLKERAKKKEKKVLDFYRFQERERNRTKLADLRQKFEEDRTKIQNMRNSRKFRPY